MKRIQAWTVSGCLLGIALLLIKPALPTSAISHERAQPVPTAVGTLIPKAEPSTEPPIGAPPAVVTVYPTSPPEPTGAYVHASPSNYWVGEGQRLVGVSGGFNGKGCVWTRLEYGDGLSKTEPCNPDEWDARILLTPDRYHTYQEAGIYYPRMVVTTQEGWEYVSDPYPVETGPPIFVDYSSDYRVVGICLLSLLLVVFSGVSVAWLGSVGWRRALRLWLISAALFAVVTFVLITWVPPFSALPNPLGLYWRQTGDYAYDPRLPFKNDYLVAKDPTSQLKAQLDTLLGKTGLDPLDPVQPLARYEFTRVRPFSSQPGVSYVTVMMVYNDGTSRSYSIPLLRSAPQKKTYLEDWIGVAMSRLQTEHRPLMGVPLAIDNGANSPVELATPIRLAVDEQAHELDSGNLENWLFGYGYDPSTHKIEWSPDGDAVLVSDGKGLESRDLWVLPLDGSRARLEASDVIDFQWLPDGKGIIYTLDAEGYPVIVAGRQGESPREVLRLGKRRLPATTEEGIWYANGGALVLAPFDGGHEQSIVQLIKADARTFVAPSPDGERIAYNCGNQLCLQDRNGVLEMRTDALPAHAASWVHDGTRLASISWDDEGLRWGTHLTVLTREGAIQKTLLIAPDGPTGKPQWSPDGRYLFLQTFPNLGRRMMAVDTQTWEVVDLTPPMWDPIFALSPDGDALLLTNGRGGFWRVGLVFKAR